jgi:hypothetical protein
VERGSDQGIYTASHHRRPGNDDQQRTKKIILTSITFHLYSLTTGQVNNIDIVDQALIDVSVNSFKNVIKRMS